MGLGMSRGELGQTVRVGTDGDRASHWSGTLKGEGTVSARCRSPVSEDLWPLSGTPELLPRDCGELRVSKGGGEMWVHCRGHCERSLRRGHHASSHVPASCLLSLWLLLGCWCPVAQGSVPVSSSPPQAPITPDYLGLTEGPQPDPTPVSSLSPSPRPCPLLHTHGAPGIFPSGLMFSPDSLLTPRPSWMAPWVR